MIRARLASLLHTSRSTECSGLQEQEIIAYLQHIPAKVTYVRNFQCYFFAPGFNAGTRFDFVGTVTT